MISSSRNKTGSVSSSEPNEEISTWSHFLRKFSHRDLKHQQTENKVDLAGKRVLITGAAGWIGSALAKSLAHLDLASLILLDSAEAGLYEVNQALLEMGGSTKYTAVLASVCDSSAIADLFDRFRPEVVFHAAALKHVPLMETNPFAVVNNNALGTQILVEAATKFGCRQMVMVSTDKAVDPHSLMGASKRIAELMMFALHPPTLHLKIVRLGNVLGSSGSVVPLFLRQIASGAPVTVSDPEVSRYFMTLTEAIQALLDAASPGCPDGLFVPDLGDPIRILDLARHLISEHDLRMGPPEEKNDTSIVFTSLRPGDKMAESLISERESYLHGSQGLLRAVYSPAFHPDKLTLGMSRLHQAIEQRNLHLLLDTVQLLVPEYQPSLTLREQLSTADTATVVV